MELILYIIFIFAFGIFLYKIGKGKEEELTDQYMNGIHVELLNSDEEQQPSSQLPINPVTSGSPTGKVKVVIGGDSDAPVQELRYFCLKDKGYHVSVWPKDQGYQGIDYLEFNIAGLNHRDNSNYLGEFTGYLEAEPTNEYDPNAIKVLAHDSHHVGYVPQDQTKHVREFLTLPCPCYCYIGKNNGRYFSDCYIIRK